MLTDVYQASEVSDHICPIALTLGADRVAEVRHISFKLVSIFCLVIVDTGLTIDDPHCASITDRLISDANKQYLFRTRLQSPKGSVA